MVLLKIDLWK